MILTLSANLSASSSSKACQRSCKVLSIKSYSDAEIRKTHSHSLILAFVLLSHQMLDVHLCIAPFYPITVHMAMVMVIQLVIHITCSPLQVLVGDKSSRWVPWRSTPLRSISVVHCLDNALQSAQEYITHVFNPTKFSGLSTSTNTIRSASALFSTTCEILQAQQHKEILINGNSWKLSCWWWAIKDRIFIVNSTNQ